MNRNMLHRAAFLVCLSVLSTTAALAQKIKISNDTVFVDETACLTISGNASHVSFHSLDGEEIFFLKTIHNSGYASTYSKVAFLDSGKTLTSKSFIFTKKKLIKKLIADGTLTNCALVPDKVEKFVLKYDENVEG